MSILGIGAGKIELRLNRTDLHPGEVIEGSASLSLNEPIKARGVMVEFWAQKRERRGKSSYTRILYKKEERLDSEKEYRAGMPMQYQFKFTVPDGILNTTQYDSGLIGGVMGFLRDMGNNGIQWFVAAKLDVPMAFDVSARQQLRVTLRPSIVGVPPTTMQ